MRDEASSPKVEARCAAIQYFTHQLYISLAHYSSLKSLATISERWAVQERGVQGRGERPVGRWLGVELAAKRPFVGCCSVEGRYEMGVLFSWGIEGEDAGLDWTGLRVLFCK